MKLVVGVDSSTQSCKVEIRDLSSGALVSFGSAPHPATFPPKSEQDPEQWWDAFRVALHQAIGGGYVDAESIVSVAVAAQCHGMVTLDGDMQLVRPAKLWNDTESSSQSDQLVASYGREYWISEVGSLISSAFTITKLAWLKENEPDRFSEVEKVCLPHDFLTWRLSNRLVTDRAGATCTGYYSLKQDRWLYELLQRIDETKNWSDALPEVLGPETAASNIVKSVAAEFELNENVTVGPGTGDQMAAGIGLGIREGDFVFSIGTSAVVFTVSSAPVYDPSGLVNTTADARGMYMPEIVGLNGTKITDWAAKIMNCSLEELGELALDAEIDNDSPVAATFFDGERAPNLPFATGTIAGLNARTDRARFARSIFDGVLLPLVQNHQLLKKLVKKSNGRIILTGGASRSRAYQQILADLLQRDVYVLDVDESVARGACVQAAAISRKVTVREVIELWQPGVLRVTSPRQKSDFTHYLSRYEVCARWRGLDRGVEE